MEELGIRKVIDDLAAKGRPADWPAKVVDPSDPGVCYLPNGELGHRSKCLYYEGYYLCGGAGSVRCKTAGELLPGIVNHCVCSKEYEKCPFYKEANK